MIRLYHSWWEILCRNSIGSKTKNELSFLSENPKVDDICVDSGQGAPESLSKYTKELHLLSPFFNCHSCGLHNIQSVLHYLTQLCIGTGGLENDDAIQLLHTMYVFYINNRSYWCDSMKDIAVKLGYTEQLLPRKLASLMQAPLIPRWWSISGAAGNVNFLRDFTAQKLLYVLLNRKYTVCAHCKKSTYAVVYAQ